MKKAEKKILIVEDDPNFVSILKEKFIQNGFLIFTAKDGKEGFFASKKEKPDLVISDILLPRLNGIDMVKQIKDKNAGMPVIFLTNVKDPNYLSAIKKMKNIDYLIKSDMRLDDIVRIAKRRLNIR